MTILPAHIVRALDEGESVVATVETDLEDHTSWVSVLPLDYREGFPRQQKNGQDTKYRIEWVEMADTYMELYKLGGDINAKEQSTRYTRDYAVSLEEVETILLKRLTDLSKLKPRRENRIHYPR